MFTDSLGKAETLAYRAYMLSSDSTMERSSLALLCYIYYREGKQEQLQLLMQTVSPDTYINMMDVQGMVERTKAGYERQYYIAALIVLLLVSGIVCFWYIRRMRTINGIYRQRMNHVRQELLSKESNITQSTILPIGETKRELMCSMPLSTTRISVKWVNRRNRHYSRPSPWWMLLLRQE